MAQRNRAALAEQETIMDTVESQAPASNAAIEVSDSTIVVANKPVIRAVDPEVQQLRDLQRQYKALYGYKPTGMTAQQVEEAVRQRLERHA